MKKNLITLFLMTLPFIGFSQNEIIYNYAFDTGITPWVAGTLAAVSYDASAGALATGSLKLVTSGNYKVAKTTSLSINGTGDYILSFNVKPDAGNDILAKIKSQLNQGGNVAGAATKITALPSTTRADLDTWYAYSHTFSSLSAANLQIFIIASLPGTYYIDDVKFEKVVVGCAGSEITTSVASSGGGTAVILSPEDCYASGATAVVNAVACGGFEFSQWEITNNGVVSNATDNPLSYIAASNATVEIKANFTASAAAPDTNFNTAPELSNWIATNHSTAAYTSGAPDKLTWNITGTAPKLKYDVCSFSPVAWGTTHMKITYSNETANTRLRLVIPKAEGGIAYIDFDDLETGSAGAGVAGVIDEQITNANWVDSLNQMELFMKANNVNGDAILGDFVINSIEFYDPSSVTITSLADGNWNDATKWDRGVVPSAGNDVIIDHVVSINGDREAKNVTVSATGSLFINANTHSLHVFGDFTNEATADKVVLRGNSSQFSSIIVEGTATGAIRFRRHVNVSPLNDLISPPVRISSFASFYAENYQFIFEDPISDKVLFGPFDNINDVYENYLYTDGIALTQGKGYRAATNTNPVDENGDAIDPAQALNFHGVIETGNVNVPITVGAGSPWNLIGNPYSSYLNFKAFFDVLTDSENLGAANQLDPMYTAIYAYNASVDGSSIWTTWDANNLDYATDNITPGQGFFVKSKVGGGSVAFTPDMRIIGDTDDFISGRPSTTNLAFAKLNLTSSSNSSSTNFYFRDFNTLGIDAGYDTGAYDQSADGMFSNLVENNTGVSLVNQSLPFSSLSDLTVALVVNAVAGEPLTFSIDASTSLPANTNVYIEDLVAGATTLLNTSNYVLTPASNLSGAGRFYLVFSAKTLNTTKEDFSNIRMYTAEKELIIAGLLLDNTRVKIFDLQGRVILSVPLETSSQLNTVKMNQFSNGIYIVQLTNDTKVKSQKIILK